MIIAEIGINHLGNIKLFRKYINFLNRCKIEAITIQLLSKNFFKGDLKKYYINREILLKTFIKLSSKKIGIISDKYDHLINQHLKYIDFFKILGSQTNKKTIIDKLSSFKKPVYLSNRGLNKIKEKKIINLVKKKNNFYIIHTQLKTHKNFTNLKKLKILNKILNGKVCFGSHSNDHSAVIKSLKYKPKKIFFYIKDNRDLEYPDNSYAIPLKNLKKLIKKIK